MLQRTRWFLASAAVSLALVIGATAFALASSGGSDPNSDGTSISSPGQQSGYGESPAVPAPPSFGQQDMVKRPAPIESVKIVVNESFPVEYALNVNYGLPGGCAKPGGYDVVREGETVTVTVSILLPSSPTMVCTQIYGIASYNIPLGSDFLAGHDYAIAVNGQIKTLTAK